MNGQTEPFTPEPAARRRRWQVANIAVSVVLCAGAVAVGGYAALLTLFLPMATATRPRPRRLVRSSLAIASPMDLERLRIAYRAARMITESDSAEVAQVWFQGLNPVLDDRSPASLLREGSLDDVGRQVLAAARHFASLG